MNRSDLIHKVSKKVSHLKKTDVIEATFLLTDLISNTLYKKDRVEIRSFGTFSVRERSARLARNPKTGSSISVSSKSHSYFRPSKLLKQVVNN